MLGFTGGEVVRVDESAERVRHLAPSRAGVQSARERLLSDGDHDAGAVRTDIATSWQRSLRTGVVADSVDVPYDDSLPTPHRLLEAARPVVDQMAAQLLDTSATFLLANSDAQIVERWACPSFLPTLDRFSVAPGFVYAEDRVGTNGVGCAIEERRLFEVRGPEHFRDCLQSLVCVAAPIVLATTNTVQGALNVTCTVEEANGFLKPLVRNAIADIEQRMLEATSWSERLLLDAFLARARGSTRAVLAFGNGLVMANDAADRFVHADDRTSIWNWASDALRTHDATTRSFTFGDDDAVEVAATRIGDESRVVGAIIEVPLPRGRRPSRGPTSAGSRANESECIVGRSPATVRLRRAVVAAASDPKPTVVIGPAGSGKTTVAIEIASHGADHRSPLVIDDPTVRLDDGDPGPGSAVIVRRIDNMPIAHVAALLETARTRGMRLVATTPSADAARLAMFDRRVDVPPLRDRIDDLPAIAKQLLNELSSGERAMVLRPDAVRTLMRHDWPGNYRELRAVLEVAAIASNSRDIAVFHLPEALGRGEETERWTTIELAERQAIMRALSEHDGNKRAAATALGLARSTLYRKMRTFGISVA